MQRARAWLVRLVLLAVAVEVLWVLVANALLASGLVAALANRRPERIHIHWESARSWYPTRVQTRGLRYQQRTRTLDIAIRASRAGASFRILPLLGSRGVLDDLDAHDVEVAIERRESPPPAPADARPGFRLGFENVEVHGIERLSFDEFAISGGEPRIRGSAGIQIRGPMALRDADLAWRDARIQVRGQTVAESISLGFRGSIAPFHPGPDAARAILEGTSATVEIHGDSDTLRPLHLLLPDVDWIERLDGAGEVAAHMLLDAGRLQPGTDVDVVAQRLELWFLGFAAGGSGRVQVDVTGNGDDRRGQMDVVIDRFHFGRQGAPEPLARGSGLTLVTSARDLGFAPGIEGLDIALDIPHSEVPDVSRLAAALPPGLGIALTGGRAKLSGHLETHGTDVEGKGFLEIEGSALQGRFRDMAFETDLAFVTRISGRELDGFDVGLAGTELRLFNGAFDGEEIDSGDGWWMTIGVPEGVTHLRPPLKTSAAIELSMRDTRAVLAAFAEVNRWIHYFDRLLSVRDVAGTASLRIDGPRLSVLDIALAGHHLELLGELELREDGSEGIFWAKRGPFSLALERLDDDNDFKLLDDREWYAEQHAAHWADR